MASRSVPNLPRLWQTSLLAALILVAIPWPVPTAAAQGTASIDESDSTDDVRLKEPQQGPAAPRSEGMDLTRVEIGGESGVSIVIRVTLRDLVKEIDNTDAVNNGIIVTSCFELDGKQLATFVRFRLGIGALLGIRQLGIVDGTCVPGQPVTFSKFVSIGYDVHVDLARSQVTMAIDRLKIQELTGSAPAKGAKVSGLYVMINDGNNNRFDFAPDGGPSTQTLILAYDTANLGSLRAAPITNIPDTVCAGRIDFPAYAVEAGTTQGVPIEFHSSAAGPVQVNFRVATIEGQDWKPKIVPTLEVPPSEKEGNTTVTVIVALPAGTKHKECSILSVQGVANTGDIGETGVIVVAIQPPSPEHKKLWLHTNPNARGGADCGGRHSWLNVIEDDPDDAAVDVMMKGCRDAEVFTWTNTVFTTILDVSPNYDLVINTSAPGVDKKAEALVRMRSDHSEAKSRLTVNLVTLDDELIATGTQDVVIGTSPTDIRIPMNIDFTRDVRGEGDPSRVLRSSRGLAWVIGHEPIGESLSPTDLTADTPSTVFLMSEGTYVELPIVKTIKRNVNNPGQLGALVSLRPNAALPEFAPAGASRVIAFTVLNEGAQADRVLADVTIEGVKNWTARFVPEPPYELAPGQRGVFSLAITPPIEAEESEMANIEVVVHSERDPTARTSVAFQVKATHSELEGDTIPGVAEVKKKGMLPAPGTFGLIAALGVAVALLGRRPL